MTPASLTFVLVDGAFMTGDMWRQTASVLRGDGHIVHTPTLAGQDPGDPMTLAHAGAVASLTGYLHDHDLSDVVLVGHSIGGAYIAQAAAQARDPARSWSEAVTCGVVTAGDVPGVSGSGGQGPGGTMEVPTLTIFCREGHPPADDIFTYPRCPQPAPA
jgi:pimeloyl-ACP methyl ester carboxylesterase